MKTKEAISLFRYCQQPNHRKRTLRVYVMLRFKDQRATQHQGARYLGKKTYHQALLRRPICFCSVKRSIVL